VEEQNQVLGLRITNQTPDQALGPGKYTLYYIIAPEDQRVFLAEWDLTLGIGQQSEFLAFPDPPAGFRGYLLVYKGNLGFETDAIVAQEVDPFPGAYGVYIGKGLDESPPAEPNEYEWSYAVPGTTPIVDMDVSTWWGKIRGSTAYSMGRYSLNMYRALVDSPGDTLRLTRYADSGSTGCFRWDYDLLTGAAIGFTVLGSATVRISELQLPRRVTDLNEFTWSSPPVKVRTIETVTASDGMAPKNVDIRGVRFLGVELLSEPPAPVWLEGSGGQSTQCVGMWTGTVVPPPPPPSPPP
jgi:hypothetical protein